MLTPPRRRGRPQKYPWDTWFNGEPHLLQQGRDYSPYMSIDTLRAQVYARARKMGVVVKVRRYGEAGYVIQRLPDDTPYRGRGRPPEHDWDRLLDGNSHRLRRRVDFTGTCANFAATARAAARRRGMRATVTVEGDEVQLLALPRLPSRAPEPTPAPMANLVPDEEQECTEERIADEESARMVEAALARLEDSNVLESLLSTPSPSERLGEAVSGERPQTQEVDSGTAWTAASAE